MGSGDWFKNIISLKKVKDGNLKQIKGSTASTKSNGFKLKKKQQKVTTSGNGPNGGNLRVLDVSVEELAATRIQTAFRAHRARKSLRRLKGTVRLQILTQKHSVKKQATSTLHHLHSWSKIQAQIRVRRLSMVAEGQLRQKKIENPLKLEAKLHDLEVEWSGGPETMEETLARIHQREEAAVKRERAMAYAFTHQWRANCSQNLGPGNYELSKANWGWSWMDNWIATRPWERRIPCMQKSKKQHTNKIERNSISPTIKPLVPSKPPLSNGKGTKNARRLSYPGAEKPTPIEANTKPGEVVSSKKEQLVS